MSSKQLNDQEMNSKQNDQEENNYYFEERSFSTQQRAFFSTSNPNRIMNYLDQTPKIDLTSEEGTVIIFAINESEVTLLKYYIEYYEKNFCQNENKRLNTIAQHRLKNVLRNSKKEVPIRDDQIRQIIEQYISINDSGDSQDIENDFPQDLKPSY